MCVYCVWLCVIECGGYVMVVIIVWFSVCVVNVLKSYIFIGIVCINEMSCDLICNDNLEIYIIYNIFF